MNSGLIDGGGDGIGPAWRIRVAQEFRLNDAAILIIAAHEVAHLVLLREQLEWQNEELVDTAIVLLGYGPLMRRFRSEPQAVRIGGRVRTVVCGPGYLHPSAIDHLCLRRVELLREMGEPRETDHGTARHPA